MKRFSFLLALLLTVGAGASAQKKAESVNLFEEAYARAVEPEVKVYIRPQVAEVEFLSKERETYGPYKFEINKLSDLNEDMFENFKGRAIYRASLEADADIMVGVIMDSYVTQADQQHIIIEFSAYPAKYVNFHKFGDGPNDIELIKACYPAMETPYGKLIEEQLKAGAARSDNGR